MNIVRKSYHKFAAVVTVGIMAGWSDAAQAQNNFTKITGNISTSIEGLPGMISGIAYLFGLLLAVLGILKIKDHVENPTQTQLKDGAIRLAAGGALFALPIMTEAMMETIDKGGSGSAVTAAELNKVQFKVK